MITCQGEGCGFCVELKMSRAALDHGQWYIASTTQHDSVNCLTVRQPGLSIQALSNLPVVRAMHSTPKLPCLRLQQSQVFRDHGIHVPIATLGRASLIVKGLAMDTAQKQLMSLGKLLQAFVAKNPGSNVIVERDSNDQLTRFFIRPGAHSTTLPALLGIAHNDAFHMKTVIFTSNLAATVLLTNQRTCFLYCIGMFPIENEEHWTWYMEKLNGCPLGNLLHQGKSMIMGDREKGEEAAAHTIFPESAKASCVYHIRKNMETQHIRARSDNKHIWSSVAAAATVSERDAWWEMLKQCEPRQYEYLSRLDKVTWQNAEQLRLGIRTHHTRTNNVVEGIGNSMCKQELGDLPIRYRAPYSMIHGILQMFCDRSNLLREQAHKLELECIEYSDYALSVFNKEDVESASNACVRVGVTEWVVRRMGIVTDKARHVKANGADLECECMHWEECGIACRHMMCVAKADKRFTGLLAKPCDQLWRNSIFIDTFKAFQVLMPSESEIYECSGDMFPGPYLIPKRVPQRGRPRVKRFRGAGEQFKRKMRKVTGDGVHDKRRQCSLCKAVGHYKSHCPVRERFKVRK